MIYSCLEIVSLKSLYTRWCAMATDSSIYTTSYIFIELTSIHEAEIRFTYRFLPLIFTRKPKPKLNKPWQNQPRIHPLRAGQFYSGKAEHTPILIHTCIRDFRTVFHMRSSNQKSQSMTVRCWASFLPLDIFSYI